MIATIVHMKNDVACIVICMPLMSSKSSTIWSSSGRLIVKRGGNVLLIGLALVGGMPDVFIAYKGCKHSLHCLVVLYEEYDKCHY